LPLGSLQHKQVLCCPEANHFPSSVFSLFPKKLPTKKKLSSENHNPDEALFFEKFFQVFLCLCKNLDVYRSIKVKNVACCETEKKEVKV